jgi:hypothetical protein
MSLDQEALAQQQVLLAAHRRTLAALLQQAAQFSAGHIPAHSINGVAEARTNITNIKVYLRKNGVLVEDELNDEPLPAAAPTTVKAEKITERRVLDGVLEIYINQMEHLLIDRKLLKSQPDDEVRHIARIRTLTALRRLDGEHNQVLIQFLRDVGLLIGQPSPIIDISQSDLREVDLRGAILREVNLRRADLRGASLCEADLESSDLKGARLEGASLERAYLGESDLQWADLSGADLSGANLSGANVNGTLMYGAILHETTMPNGKKRRKRARRNRTDNCNTTATKLAEDNTAEPDACL